MTPVLVGTPYFSPLVVQNASPLGEPDRAVLPGVHTPYDYC